MSCIYLVSERTWTFSKERASIPFKLCYLPVISDLKVEYVSHVIINSLTASEISGFRPLSEKQRVKLSIKNEYLGWVGAVVTFQFSSVSVLSESLRPHGLQHARPACPSPTSGFYSNSCPLSQWCHPTISSSVIPFSCLQSFPVSGSFPVSQFFTSGGQSTGVSASASVLPMNIQD